MNVHPILVHFPIAFLTTYGLFELLPLQVLRKQPYWFYVKAIILFVGVIGAGGAIIAGQLIESSYRDQASLVFVHSRINESASVLFTIIAYTYLIAWIRRAHVKIPISVKSVWNISLIVENRIRETFVLYILAAAGLVLILIGGALGGAIVYGAGLDPFTWFFYHLFFH